MPRDFASIGTGSGGTRVEGGDGIDTITSGSGANFVNGSSSNDVATRNAGDSLTQVEESLA